jgi:hypothetical protein
MIATTSKPNVYYLPTAEPVEITPPVTRWTRLRRGLLRNWWRARLSLVEFRRRLRAGRRRSRADEYSALLESVVLNSPAEVVERRRPKPTSPATILDFEGARLRLRPRTA